MTMPITAVMTCVERGPLANRDSHVTTPAMPPDATTTEIVAIIKKTNTITQILKKSMSGSFLMVTSRANQTTSARKPEGVQSCLVHPSTRPRPTAMPKLKMRRVVRIASVTASSGGTTLYQTRLASPVTCPARQMKTKQIPKKTKMPIRLFCNVVIESLHKKQTGVHIPSCNLFSARDARLETAHPGGLSVGAVSNHAPPGRRGFQPR